MHHAPSVSYPVGRCSLARLLWWGHSLLSATLWASWGWAQSLSPIWWCTGGVLALVAHAGWRAQAHGPDALQWDGVHWRVLWTKTGEQSARIGQVKAVLDVQSTLLLQWQPLSSTLGDSGQWVWLTRVRCPELWQDVRRAVYSPHR